MNKKNLLIAALPVFMAACSSEDVLTDVQNNDQYAGIAKVNAQFNVANGVESRLATKWGMENNDVIGLAWLGDDKNVTIDGKAYQNHPLYAVGEGVNAVLQPKTSIYVGDYFSYAPYDYATKQVGKINFSVENQDLKERGTKDEGVAAAAAKSIWISPRWTSVTLDGEKDAADNTFNNAGIDNTFKMYPRKFSNMVQLQLTYKNNEFDDADTPEIKSIEVSFPGSVKSFTYAPAKAADASTNALTENYWYNYNLKTGDIAATTDSRAGTTSVAGVEATEGSIKLTGKSLAEGSGNTFVYNSLPSKDEVTKETQVTLRLTATYGVVTITKTVSEIAKTYVDEKGGYDEYFDGEVDAETGNLLSKVSVDRSFVAALNQNGKFITEVDFLTAVMDGMHVENDTELQKMLNYYINHKKNDVRYAETKSGTDIKLYLDGDADGKFELSKTSINMIKDLNKGQSEKFVSIQPCTDENVCSEIVITEGGEVPEMTNVFEKRVDVSLAEENWTWATTPTNSQVDANADLVGKNFGNVKTITNYGTLTISTGNIKARTDNGKPFTAFNNAEGAVINVKAVASVKFNVVNKGQINVASNAELLAYGSTIENANWKERNDVNPRLGKIYNDGVIGVVKDTEGEINNYGYIKNKRNAKTYITTNQTTDASFAEVWGDDNKIGTIELTDKFDNISVSNATEQGFIKYTWNGEAAYTTPEPAVDVKYNYLIVKNDIAFTESEEEVKYLEVAAGADIVITAETTNKVFEKPYRLRGLILGNGAKANIKKGNTVNAAAAYISAGKLYVGGIFGYDTLETYCGGADSNTDNIVEY